MAHTIQDLHREFEAAFNAADVDGLAAMYEAGAVMAAQPGQYARGAAEVRATLAAILSSGMKIKLSTVYVMERDDLALCSCDYVLSGGDAESRGRTSELARRQADGKWRYAIDNPWSA